MITKQEGNSLSDCGLFLNWSHLVKFGNSWSHLFFWVLGFTGSPNFLDFTAFLVFTGFRDYTGFLGFSGLAGIGFITFAGSLPQIRNLEKKKEKKRKCITP